MSITAKSRFLLLAGLVLSLALPHDALAAVSCTFTTSPSINFGTLDPLALPATPVQVSTTVSIHCTGGATQITVSLSQGSAGSFAPRSMNDGAGHTLTYNIYTDNTYATVWGDSTAGTATVSQAGLSGSHTYTFTLFGQLPETGKSISTIDPNKGTYTDTITVTTTFF